MNGRKRRIIDENSMREESTAHDNFSLIAQESMGAAIQPQEEYIQALLEEKDVLFNQEREKSLQLEKELELMGIKVREQNKQIEEMQQRIKRLETFTILSVDQPITKDYSHIPWQKAAKEANLDALRWWLEKGGIEIDCFAKYFFADKTALHIAASEGHLEVVKWLVANGASIAKKDKDGWSALHVAAWMGRLEIVKWLIAKGAPVHEKNGNGDTALQLAATVHRLAIAEWLITKGASIGKKRGYELGILFEAAKEGHLKLVNGLLAIGFSVWDKNSYGETALHHAAFGGYLQMVEYLLEKGASVNEKDNSGETALHRAVFAGACLEVVKLLANKDTIHMKNHYGRTALDLATKPEVKEFLKNYCQPQPSSNPSSLFVNQNAKPGAGSSQNKDFNFKPN